MSATSLPSVRPYQRCRGRATTGPRPAVRRRPRSVFAAVVVLLSVLIPVFGVASPAAAMDDRELRLAAEMFGQLNDERAARGLPALTPDPSLAEPVIRWADAIAGRGNLVHSDDGRAEIIAYGRRTGQITRAWMESPGHRNLVTDPNLVPAAVAVTCDADGRMWAVVQFRRVDRTLGTQRSSSASPVATSSATGGSCDAPPSDTELVNSLARLYSAYFLRAPDDSGLRYWEEQAMRGMNLWTISEHFAESREFRTRYGSLDDAAFVDLVYRNVVRRTADSTGRSFWLQRLRGGLGRGELMTYFSDSPEYRQVSGID